ncbi:hypothetical protein F5B22DRAFT_600957 [Xylaria bambusicola]|uniref:uncharacterized protein n=1 Tax=Xylaria bambusicola TaxID=326684 RepID=UPI002007AA6A|nr:uncharacterized protein F5B22DRAFT_600957 [Xylaria bambusicola]KAI0518372.1 hypothetical protein F5B22DRAFT_600957 [Xylaria bambusicola]
MAMNETSHLPTDHQERAGRRRPFATWVKKLANFKAATSSTGGNRNGHSKRDAAFKGSKKRASKNNNPYPQSGRIAAARTPRTNQSPSTSQAGLGSNQSLDRSRDSSPSSADESPHRATRANSTAPTLSTDHHSIHAPSHMASSVAGTSRTAGGGFDARRGGDSTFSSPAPSVRSLTTTLTTIQSLAPNGGTNGGHTTGGHSSHQSNTQTIQFTQPFPTNSPASAIPPHLAPHGHPTTYNSATANNLLTDNASILTLASSSKRRRRRSMDTDASVRALAPSSVWGGSRESLPLSVLSANMDGMRDIPPTPGLHQSSTRIAGNERTSIYSTTGIAPALPGERNSLYAGKQSMGDGASIRSSLPGHGRADSISGSVAGVNSPLASPMEVSERSPMDKDENQALKEKGKEKD